MSEPFDNIAGIHHTVGLDNIEFTPANIAQFRSWAGNVPNGTVVAYKTVRTDGNPGFETGVGTYSGGTLTRTVVKTSTTGNNLKHAWDAGEKITFLVVDSEFLNSLLRAANNLAELTNKATARTNLGVAIGSDVQAYSAVLAGTTASYTTTEKTKLSGIEAGATADQTGAEIKALYEGESNTNAFTDTEKSKLAGVEVGATADLTGAEIKTLYESQANTNAFTDTEKSKLSGVEAGATADQTGAEIKALYEGETNTNAFTDTEKSKLGGIESGATADQTGAEIKAAYEGEDNTNAFTDAEKSKLAGLDGSLFLGVFVDLEALETAYPSPGVGSYAYVDAGVDAETTVYIWDDSDEVYQELSSTSTETAASIKTKYESNPDTNAFTDAEKSKLSGVESGATADQTGAEIKAAYEGESDTNAFTDAEKSKLSGVESGATADQTGAEIKTAYEGEADTNAFTDAEKAHLAVTETTTQLNARDTANRDRANHSGTQAASTIADFASTVRATVLTGLSTATAAAIAATDTVLEALGKLQAVLDTKAPALGEDDNYMTDAEKSKLSGIESGATADQSDVEIEAAYNAQVAVVSQSDAEAGAGTDARRWTAERVRQAIQKLANIVTAVVNDSGGPVTAYIHDTSTALGNADSVHTSYRVNGAGIAYIDKDGWFNGGPFLHYFFGVDVLGITEYVVLLSGIGFGFGAELTLGYDDGTSTAFLQGNGGGTYTVLIGGETHDFTFAGQHVIGPVVVSGGHSWTGATGTSQHGGPVHLRGGNAVGNGNGGDLEIFGGTKAGSGTTGRVLIKDLPVSATGLSAGTLWNDSGTIKIA